MLKINGRPANILLAEDDPADQELTRLAFDETSMSNTLYVVENGEEVLDFLLQRGQYADRAHSDHPDLLLLDLNMPKLDGRETLKQIRQHPDLRRLVVVALTTSQAEEDINQTYDLGVNSYVVKPADLDEFILTIKNLTTYWFSTVELPPN